MKRVTQFFQHPFFITIRVAAFTACAILLLVGAVRATSPEDTTRGLLLEEHRLTQLETDMIQVRKTLDSMQQVEWPKLLLMAGLSGEAALRVYRSKRRPSNTDED